MRRSLRRLLAPAAALLTLLLLTLDVLAQKPRIPPGRDPGGVPVAIIASGVNYTLPGIAERLARDGEGDLVGVDMEDGDNRPFDRTPSKANPAPAAAHAGIHVGSGTAIASILIREAGRPVRLAVVRPRLGDPHTYGNAAAFAAHTGARVVVLSVTSTGPREFEIFARAAAHFQDLLFIVVAGDEARDLDAASLYPASLGLANILVVTAATGDGKLVEKAGFGPRTVDVAIVAEAIDAVDADGKPQNLTGTAVAAARAAALAVRLTAAEPALKGAGLKAKLLTLAAPMAGPARTRTGWIARPLDVGPKR